MGLVLEEVLESDAAGTDSADGAAAVRLCLILQLFPVLLDGGALLCGAATFDPRSHGVLLCARCFDEEISLAVCCHLPYH